MHFYNLSNLPRLVCTFCWNFALMIYLCNTLESWYVHWPSFDGALCKSFFTMERILWTFTAHQCVDLFCSFGTMTCFTYILMQMPHLKSTLKLFLPGLWRNDKEIAQMYPWKTFWVNHLITFDYFGDWRMTTHQLIFCQMNRLIRLLRILIMIRVTYWNVWHFSFLWDASGTQR